MSDDNVKEEPQELAAAEATTEPAPPPNAVLLQREITPDGKINVSVMTMGDVRLTEVRDILALGMKQVTRELGL